MKSDLKASVEALMATLKMLTDEELLALTDYPGKLKEFCGTLVAEISQNTFVYSLSDQDILEQFCQFYGCLASWRKYAVVADYHGPVAWRVKPGFTLKTHAPLVGPCHQELKYLQGWNLQEAPTVDSLVFWVPRLAAGSTGKTIGQMEAHRAEQRQIYNLPANHCDRFGSITLLFALLLAHFRRTGERVPINFLNAASDTSRSCGARLIAGHFYLSEGFNCDCWIESSGQDNVGYFLLGVEELSRPVLKVESVEP